MERRIYWRGLTLACCALIGVVLGAAAITRYPPAASRASGEPGRSGRRALRPSTPDREVRSDFNPVTTPDQRLGLLEYAGSATMLWLGPILWWTRNRPGMPAHRINPARMDGAEACIVFVLVGSITLAVAMTAMSINAILGGSGAMAS